MTGVISPQEARGILGTALEATDAPDVFAWLRGGSEALTRFGAGEITQNVERRRATLTVVVRRGRREGSASTDELTREGVHRAALWADEAARHAPEDPESLPSLGPQSYTSVEAWVEATAQEAPEARARRAAEAIEVGRRSEMVASGTVSTGMQMTALASRAGLWAYHCWTEAGFTVTMRTEDGAGSARVAVEDRRHAAEIDAAGAAHEAADRARRSVGARELPAGRYTVVLEPPAVADLLGYLLWSMDAREADEGRSYFAGKMGQGVADERVTIRTDPAHPWLRHVPFTDEGLPIAATTWIERGELRTLAYSRYWAQQRGRAPTSSPVSIVMGGSERAEVEDLVRGTERGILISRFWYIRMVDPKRISVTGLTRDGTFWIEDGQVRGPVINYRFNDSPIRVLAELEALSRPQKVGRFVVPALLVGGFNLTSPSPAV